MAGYGLGPSNLIEGEKESEAPGGSEMVTEHHALKYKLLISAVRASYISLGTVHEYKIADIEYVHQY